MKNFFFQFFTWWNGQTLATRFYTWLYGKKVGQDEVGNIYFESSNDKLRNSRRWVVYNAVSDPSSIPSGWHAWIHHRSDVLPTDEHYIPYFWEKPHQPNMTGTQQAYRPKSSILRDGTRAKVSGDYEAWIPSQD